MGLLLNKIQDPRSPLERVRRRDLRKWIEQNKNHDSRLEKIDPWMPHILMVKELHSMGIHNIDGPIHRLGMPDNPKVTVDEVTDAPNGNSNATEVDHASLLAAEWKPPKSINDIKVPAELKSIDDMTLAELRREVKKRGLKQKRTDKADDLRARLNGDTS